ncbi:signal transduction histidine kinase/CHASE3 domain sensor protein [Actinoplanes lutulentus]|uniref:histidine kinase n=1 Tax=Actinoplanes lutulentus TaxID=1287878 RepID=A0A327Z0D6_9ACTN|nr:ATP-binding protein [Actinoplanes lutulentus]MBB2943646.1 signal transduction histidine kinase/CHASE3 domain sensor protein [Actinoplanes lutulentus]RAK27511.1 HAMP domain-containing protein [Actinoplanes lutulentus]
MSVQRRLNLGFAALFLLFVTFLVVQLVVGGRVRSDHDDAAARIVAARFANDRVLQQMTNAETGVRGFQLTGDRSFLEPYETGRSAAIAALDEVAEGTRDLEVRQILGQESAVVHAWLEEYAAPIVTSTGGPVADSAAAEDVVGQGKRMFDELRLVNEAVGQAIDAEMRGEDNDRASALRAVEIGTALLLLAILAVAYAVARTGRRQLLVPLGLLGGTIRRLAQGDRTARAQAAGAEELRSVVDALNDLASQTEDLLAAEKARAARAGLRQAVAAELQDLRAPDAAVHRIAELIGAAVGIRAGSFGAGTGTVHCELAIPGTGSVEVDWPAGTGELPEDLIHTLLAGGPGKMVIFDDGALGVTIGGDADCEPGFLRVRRTEAQAWTDAERRLLAGVAGAIERALRQLTLQYRQARLITELRMLDHRKDVFIQTVTHELRTPLTSILGYTEMLTEESGELSPLQKRSLSAIMRNAHRLHETIADLVLLDRPEAGSEVSSEPLDLGELATTVRTELENAARAKELSVTFDADECWVLGDRIQLQRALRKLMENAIKFTPSGGSVRCSLSADERSVSVAVTDTGIGIPAEDVPGLFTPFHRAGNAVDQAVQGPGLGLAIVRDIVSDHGGTITVQSVVGRGSTFTLTLPVVPAPVPESVPVG